MPDTAVAARPVARWSSWLLGVATLVALVAAVAHVSEEREFARLVARVRPWWLAWAALLQAATYLPQAGVWRAVPRAAGVPVSLATAYGLCLTKLFVDQALPSAGVSGTVMMAEALERRGVPRPVVMASVVVSTASYYLAYVLSLGAGLTIAVARGHASPLVLAIALPAAAFAVVVALAALALSGRRETALTAWLRRVPVVTAVLAALQEAEPRLAHHPRLLVRATGFQLVIVLLDAATLWVLLRSLGATTTFAGVFASFVIANLFRTVSVMPGGLGAFEAASVVSLKLMGVPVLAALSATMLFRGLSFWLPMVPGLMLSTSRPGTADRARSRSP